MTAASLRNFMNAADATLQALFPTTVVIAGVTYAAVGVGGGANRDYVDGGNAPNGARHFRISKELLLTRPESGTLLTWAAAPSGVTAYTITEVPDRPHETSWTLTCVPRTR